MGRWADWFSTPDEVACEFVRAAESIGDVAVHELLRPFIEDSASDVTLDKTWEPIHRCLTGDHGPAHVIDFAAGTRPLKLAVFGGCYLLEAGSRSLQYVCNDEVPEVAEALAEVQESWFRERFFALPRNQYHPITEDYFEYVWADFKQVIAFYRKAAERKHVAFCSVDH
jgi:hypothetical protein